MARILVGNLGPTVIVNGRDFARCKRDREASVIALALKHATTHLPTVRAVLEEFAMQKVEAPKTRRK